MLSDIINSLLLAHMRLLNRPLTVLLLFIRHLDPTLSNSSLLSLSLVKRFQVSPILIFLGLRLQVFVHLNAHVSLYFMLQISCRLIDLLSMRH